ncbi:unnamed protein product [Rotaria sp. Silwood2]|nr:unnamed protein product [Rotaria sp. Silwood2]CAF2896060.1 unnamed protein product [Rotaria sp. Silwood2]CAF4440100.1 unnamed protein product [Rotaria sp. Silwood2]
MNILNSNDINILDLPDEILSIIFNKLNTIDIFYSLVDVNHRFDRLSLDSLVIHHLDFAIERSHVHNSSVDTYILDKVCSKILPQINDKITKLTLDPFSTERILSAVKYPQLHSLSLVNYQSHILLRHLKDGVISFLNDQITDLTVDIYHDKGELSDKLETIVFVAILFYCRYLTDLNFSQKFSSNYLSFVSCDILQGCSLSSSLTNLTIKVNSFNDCLHLLNECLQYLSTLIIRIKKISRPSSNINNKEKLCKLKCFSLVGEQYSYCYDTLVVPLLRRMLNLEELSLQLSVIRAKTSYIDGNQLYEQVLKYLPRLNKFMFNIHTHIINTRIDSDLPSNDDIRNSFIKQGFQLVGTCATKIFRNNGGDCHVYSLPYPFSDFLFLSNCFQGGQFNKVRILMMLDRYPFEHKLFKIISEDFPFLQKLIILNLKEQKNDQHHSSTLITFNHLLKLNLISAHNAYATLFLSDRSTRLPCLTNLKIRYSTLASVTNNFTNDETRLNCAKIKSLYVRDLTVHSQNFNSYFPSLCDFS